MPGVRSSAGIVMFIAKQYLLWIHMPGTEYVMMLSPGRLHITRTVFMLQVPLFICHYLLLNLQVPFSTRRQPIRITVLFTPDFQALHKSNSSAILREQYLASTFSVTTQWSMLGFFGFFFYKKNHILLPFQTISKTYLSKSYLFLWPPLADQQCNQRFYLLLKMWPLCDICQVLPYMCSVNVALLWSRAEIL